MGKRKRRVMEKMPIKEMVKMNDEVH